MTATYAEVGSIDSTRNLVTGLRRYLEFRGGSQPPLHDIDTVLLAGRRHAMCNDCSMCISACCLPLFRAVAGS